MCLESFINCYAVENFTKTYFENYLDKLELKAKWLLIPKLIMGKQIEAGNIAFQGLSNLVVMRNKLVHDKPKSKIVSALKQPDWVTESDATNAINVVKNIIQDLKKIDSNVTSNWIKESTENPYV